MCNEAKFTFNYIFSFTAKHCLHLRSAALGALYPPKNWLARLSAGTRDIVPLNRYRAYR